MHHISPIARIRGDLIRLTEAPSGLGKFLLAVTKSSSSAGLEAWVPEGTELLLEDTTNISLNWKLRVPPGHFGILIFLS